MDNLNNYKAIVDSTLGAGSFRFPQDAALSRNPVIARLNNDLRFKDIFIARLKRLRDLYPETDKSRKHLLDSVNSICINSNWDGAYAELVAFDVLNASPNWINPNIELDKSLSSERGLAKELGYSEANFDCYYNNLGIYLDVKILSDKLNALLEGIFKDLKNKIRFNQLTIVPEHPLDMPYQDLQKNRNTILNELIAKVDTTVKPTYVKCDILPDLSFRLRWGNGVTTAEHPYNPYLHAMNHHRLVFQHAKKFLNNDTCLLLFVVSPFFSEMVMQAMNNNVTFYRAFCRRFFCQYMKDNRDASKFLKIPEDKLSIFDVTTKLSGIIFLEDKSLSSSDLTDLNGCLYVYANPNADNPFIRGVYREYLREINIEVMIDDFLYDNY